MSKFRFLCPSCSKVYKADPADAGKRMKCKKCEAEVIVPEAPKPLVGILPPETNTAPLPEPESVPTPLDFVPRRKRKRGPVRFFVTLTLFLAMLGGSIVGVFVIVSRLAERTDLPGRGPGEMSHSDLAELVTDLHKKPNVRSVVATHYREAPRPEDYLPPGGRYEYTLLQIGNMEDKSSGFAFWAYNCSSSDRAELLLKRLPKVWNTPGYTSGQFVIYTTGESLTWLRKYYRLSPAP